MVTLYDVIDTRNGQHYSVVVVSEEKAKFFVKAGEYNDI